MSDLVTTGGVAGFDEAESDDSSLSDARRALVEERRFLLRSLRDLELERQAGDIDDADYQALYSRYAVRAAAVQRRLDQPDESAEPVPARTGARHGRSTSASAQPEQAGEPGSAPRGPAAAGGRRSGLSRRRKRILVGGAMGCFAVAAIVLVAGELGVQLPGQTLTGSITLSKQQRVGRLLDQAETALIEQKDATALVAFDDVLAIEPHQSEALSEAGWLQFAAGVRAHKPALVRAGQRQESAAVVAAPGSYAPRLYYGTMLAQERDYASAVAQFDAGLADHPPASTLSVFVPTIVKAFDDAHVPVPSGLPPAVSS